MATKPQAVSLKAVDNAVAAINGQAPETATETAAAQEVEIKGVNVDEPMVDQANFIGTTANIDAITALVQAIGSEMDTNKAQISVALLNVTTRAIKMQGRDEWNTRDFLSFGVALAALSHISP